MLLSKYMAKKSKNSKEVGTRATFGMAGRDAFKYLNPKKIRRDERRAEVLRLRKEGYLLREIRKEILSRKDEFWEEGADPVYNLGTVSNDLLTTLKSTRDEMYDLADELRPVELEKLDKAEQPADKIMDRVSDLLAQYDPIEDGAVALETIVSTWNKAVNTILNIQKRRSRLLPLEVPKEMTIRKGVFTMSIEDLEERAINELENEEAIEGEYTSG